MKKVITTIAALMLSGSMVVGTDAFQSEPSVNTSHYAGCQSGDVEHLEISDGFVLYNLIVREGRFAADLVVAEDCAMPDNRDYAPLFYNKNLPITYQIITNCRSPRQGLDYGVESIERDSCWCYYKPWYNLTTEKVLKAGTIVASFTSSNTQVYLGYEQPHSYTSIIGDVDGDGQVTVCDAQYVLKYYTDTKVAGLEVTWGEILEGGTK